VSEGAGGLPTTVTGVVVHGDHRGRELGYPTANIPLEGPTSALPFGIYAGRVLGHPAAVSVGVRPTFGDGLAPILEAYLLDFDGDLYGQELTVELLEYLRPELRFDSLDSLVDQIAADVDQVRSRVAALSD
jgi:riboflavin kinase/FMN adenylyltransferase